MAQVQVLRAYRPETFSGKTFSVHFEKQREWARKVKRYKDRITSTFDLTLLPPTRSQLFVSWLSWRAHYATRALQRLVARLSRPFRRF